jgi:hypothetical protein
MILLLHISIALATVIYATYLYARPVASRFPAAYGFIVATLASGTYLVVLSPAHLAQACVSGIVFVAVVMAVLLSARRKLAQVQLTA